MQTAIYSQMAYLEKKHWWFTARRKIIDTYIQQFDLPADAQILEAGCGTGGNLAMLATHGQVWAIEPSEVARTIAAKQAQQTGVTLVEGVLPEHIPFSEQQFDLIVLLDVLEHLKDDTNSLKALKQRLKPNGKLLMTVPALPFLWSEHDEIHHHFRRYTRHMMCQCLEQTGFQVNKLSYYNFWLFPAVFTVRALKKIFKAKEQESSDLALPPTWLNNILHHLFASERYLLKYVSLPIGVSLIVTASQPKR